MSSSGKTVKAMLISFELIQGKNGASGNCENCDKVCTGNRGWWRRVSYEYDEWEVLCRSCAINHVKEFSE